MKNSGRRCKAYIWNTNIWWSKHELLIALFFFNFYIDVVDVWLLELVTLKCQHGEQKVKTAAITFLGFKPKFLGL